MSRTNAPSVENGSGVLPTDVFDRTLSRLIGLPNGAHTHPTVVQTVDFYGNVSDYIVQTVKTDQGLTVFVTEINSREPFKRIILPPKVLAALARQADTVSTMVRRRHGRRLAEERAASGVRPVFTKAMRDKALATRKANAAKRRARKGGAR